MASWKAWKKRYCAAALLGLLAGEAAWAAPVVSVSATPNPGTVSSNIVVSVLMTGITDLYAFQYSLAFNPALLQAVSVSEGAFLPSGGGTSFISGTINNTTGSVSNIADSLSGFVPGVSGTGVLASITFTVLAAGTSALTLSNALYLDSGLADIVVQSTNGSFTGVAAVVPEPASMVLMGLGIAGLAVAGRRQLRRA